MKVLIILGAIFALGATAPNSQTTHGETINVDEKIAKEFTHLFAVSIFLGHTADTSTDICAGVILSKHWVLTAGSCFTQERHLSRKKIFINAGITNLADDTFRSQLVEAYRIHLHPQFNTTGKLDNNIALLRLKKPFKLNKFVDDITLPKAGSIPSGEGTMLVWQENEDPNNQTELLTEGKYNMTSLAECQNDYPDLTITDQSICIDVNGPSSACKSDVGSPFIQYIGGEPQIIGLVSYHNNCAKGTMIFTRVSAFMDFITKTMQEYTPQVESRILNGTKVGPTMHPYLVSFVDTLTDPASIPMCGGSIIDRQWILTSASCFDYYAPNTITSFNVQKVYARVGTKHAEEKIEKDIDGDSRGRSAANQKKATTVKGVEYEVEAVFQHPLYHDDDLTDYHDIALVKLSKKLEYFKRVQPIRLPESGSTVAGRSGYIVGWTPIEAESTSKVTVYALMHGNVSVVPSSQCEEFHPKMHSSQLCMYGSSSTCSGDVGGPFVVYEKSKPVIAGVIALGGVACELEKPFVVTNVQSFLPFIEETMKTYNNKTLPN